MSAIGEVLTRAAIVRTLCQIEDIEYISFTVDGTELVDKSGLSQREASYFVKTGEVQNKGYDRGEENIRILSKGGDEGDIYEISDMLSAKAFSQITKKYFLCTPKKYYF